MRFFLLVLISLIPLCGKAQFYSGFEPGYYVLVDEPTVRHTGMMRIRIDAFHSTLMVEGEGNAKTLKFKPAQLLAIGNKKGKYLIAKDFNSGGGHIDADFARQVDSGQVVVLYHSRSMNTPIGGTVVTILVQRPTETTTTALESLYNRFRKQVLPFIETRPDLVKLVQDKQIAYYNLQTLLHVFNTGQPYPQNR